MSVKHSLLALLSTGPMYGQQLKTEFDARTGKLWPLNVGQVYTTLSRLENDGLVAEAQSDDGDEGRRPYTITAAGQVELELWLKDPDEVQPNPPRDDLIMKVMIALSIDPSEAREVIQSHRRHVLESMQRFTHLKGDPTARPPLLMMCDAELFRLEGAVRWLDSIEARILHGQLAQPQEKAINEKSAQPEAEVRR